ncbi:SPOR domain-containing protein [Pseudomonas sp. RIT-PI-AD]|uniref:SPOR domain-containing protein n=1 Tax=Pseudomonas sp. RIT-PI-AD TaxID=3035294 RepID=UPI0021DB4F1A|nr:SPOR domain-containing protein [Pseudomonas sp. RIT-PI-AD]
MAVLDKVLRQRIVGALVLLALAVVFLPMLFSREDERRHVTVDAPAMPQSPGIPKIEMDPVDVPEPVATQEDPLPPTEPIPGAEVAASEPIQPLPPAVEPTPVEPAPTPVATAKQPPPPKAVPTPTPVATPAAPAETPVAGDPESRLDENGLPISWSVQLASLSNRASAEALQKKLRNQGYNAYIRSIDGMNRVFVGPVIERAEANKLRDQLGKQQNLNGFLVRFQPERG